MIKVTGLDNREFILNADHIEKLESVPECLITLVNNKKYIVLGTCDDIVDKVIKYKHSIITGNFQEAKDE